MTRRAVIDEFLTQHRLAVIGVSRDERDFSRQLFAELERRGYDLVPVNPNAEEIAGHRSYQRVQDIPELVDGALVLTPPAATDDVVRDCVDAGIRRIWLHRGGGVGAVTPTAVAYCHEQNVAVVEGECPYMFLPSTQFVHQAHGFIRKLTGSYPS